MKNRVFKIPAAEIKTLISSSIGCVATDMITVDGLKVGYMYREAPINVHDSGWRFFSGEESEVYVHDSENSCFYTVNTIANYDPSILSYLNSAIGTAFEKKGWIGSI